MLCLDIDSHEDGVSDESISTQPKERSSFESDSELSLVQPEDLAQVESFPILPGLKNGGNLACLMLGLPVPGANVLADITTIDPVPNRATQGLGDHRFMLDGEITDTSSGIELIGAVESLRGTSIQTTPTTAAMICDFPHVVFEEDIDQESAEEEIASMSSRKEKGVFADPTEARQLGVISLHDGSGIDSHSAKNRRIGRSQTISHGAKAFTENCVVVLAPGIARDSSSLFVSWIGIDCSINQPDDEQTFGTWHDKIRIVPGIAPGLHELHLPLSTLSQPLIESIDSQSDDGRSNADQVEPNLAAHRRKFAEISAGVAVSGEVGGLIPLLIVVEDLSNSDLRFRWDNGSWFVRFQDTKPNDMVRIRYIVKRQIGDGIPLRSFRRLHGDVHRHLKIRMLFSHRLDTLFGGVPYSRKQGRVLPFLRVC